MVVLQSHDELALSRTLFYHEIFNSLLLHIIVCSELAHHKFSAGALIDNVDEVAHGISFFNRELLMEMIKTLGGLGSCWLVAHSNYNIG